MLGKVSGNWVFKGTRLTVYSLFENLAGGTRSLRATNRTPLLPRYNIPLISCSHSALTISSTISLVSFLVRFSSRERSLARRPDHSADQLSILDLSTDTVKGPLGVAPSLHNDHQRPNSRR